MSSRRRSTRATTTLLALALAAGPLAGCAEERPGAPAAATRAASADAVAAIERALEARAAAVRRGDAEAFARTLGGTPAFRAEQRTWLANLGRLPVGTLAYRLEPGSVVREGVRYRAVVEQALQLDGFDAEPVRSRARLRFERGPGEGLRLVAVRDPEWESAHHVRLQPWELGPIQVRRGAGVLGVFDADSVTGAAELVDSVEAGIADVAARVPYSWSRTVVVYALSEPRFMATLHDAPGGDPTALDAVSFAAGAGTRFVLHPRLVERPGPERDRLVRHELAHAAIGAADDGAPVWLAEGLAEWVSVQALAPYERRLTDAALRAAETMAAAEEPDLPADSDFGGDAEAHYGLSWWVIEHVADSYGDQAPWLLLDALGAPDADAETVLRDTFGTSPAELARQAAQRILATYAAS